MATGRPLKVSDQPCARCGAFERYPGGACAPCARARMRRRRQDPIARIRDKARALRRVYGLAHGEYDARLVEQCGLCAVCGDPFGRDDVPVVDHDHQTGAVRGLVHNACNVGLGMLADSPARTGGATTYLDGGALVLTTVDVERMVAGVERLARQQRQQRNGAGS